MNLDFSTEASNVQLSNVVTVPINGVATDVTLTPPTAATGSGIDCFLLKVAFYQEINGVQYPLNNGAFNALQITEVL